MISLDVALTHTHTRLDCVSKWLLDRTSWKSSRALVTSVTPTPSSFHIKENLKTVKSNTWVLWVAHQCIASDYCQCFTNQFCSEGFGPSDKKVLSWSQMMCFHSAWGVQCVLKAPSASFDTKCCGPLKRVSLHALTHIVRSPLRS